MGNNKIELSNGIVLIDLTQDTVDAEHLVSGYTAHNKAGEAVTGNMPVIADFEEYLWGDVPYDHYFIPKGYHSGNSYISVLPETLTVTPTETYQIYFPTEGYLQPDLKHFKKVISRVDVQPIPSKYGDTTGDDAVAANILSGKKAHSNNQGDAAALTGTMPNNGAVAATIDGIHTKTYQIPAGYHNGSGSVSLTSDIEDACDEAFAAVSDMGGTVPVDATIEDLADAIKTIPQSGGGTMDLLWTNGSPTANFASQTVALSAEWSDYDFILVTYIFSTSTADRATVLIPVRESLGGSIPDYAMRINAATSNRTGGRSVTLAVNSGNYNRVTFGSASYNTSTANGYVIPIIIYGIKM